MLRKLKAYISEKRIVSLSSLAGAFAKDEDVLEGMLQHYVSRGALRKLEPTGCAMKQCRGCDKANDVFYQWLVTC